MPVEQGLPWHLVATGLAGQAIPFVVAASPARALPSAPFRFPVPAVLVVSRALLCPSSLFVVLALVPLGVAPAFCVSVLLPPCLLALLGAPVAHPLLSHPPASQYEGFTSPYDVDCPVRGWVVTALLPPPWRAPPGARGAAPALVEYVGTLYREGRGCLPMARSVCAAFGGCCSARTSWFPCVLLCVLLGLVSLPCVGQPYAQLLFLLARSPLLVCGTGGAACRSLHPLVAVGLSHLQLGGTRGTGHFCTCLQIYKLTCHWCLLGFVWSECGALLLFCFLGC